MGDLLFHCFSVFTLQTETVPQCCEVLNQTPDKKVKFWTEVKVDLFDIGKWCQYRDMMKTSVPSVSTWGLTQEPRKSYWHILKNNQKRVQAGATIFLAYNPERLQILFVSHLYDFEIRSFAKEDTIRDGACLTKRWHIEAVTLSQHFQHGDFKTLHYKVTSNPTLSIFCKVKVYPMCFLTNSFS